MSDPNVTIKYMFDIKQSAPGPGPSLAPGTDHPSSPAAATAAGPGTAGDPDMPGAPVPLERVEAQICELAGHLAAATCRFLVLLGDFDARRGWASWEMNSCAQWLSWKCQMSSGTAREHVRVARALRALPVIRAEFGAGRLSYAKVRALTRIATPGTEEGLAEIAGPMTANQLERFARAHRQVSRADDTASRVRRRLAWRLEEDGSLAGTFRLPPLAGAVLLQALRAAGPPPRSAAPPATATTAAAGSPAAKPAAPTCTTSSTGATAGPPASTTSSASAPTTTTWSTTAATSSPPPPAARSPSTYPTGTPLPASPALPEPDGTLDTCHDAGITPDTIIPAWYGERLDLDYAIYTSFANADYQARQHDQEHALT
jgi:hypothetical protein